MQYLIQTIDAIIKYGQYEKLSIENPIGDLRRYLVKIYALFFDVETDFENIEYPDFVDREKYTKGVKKNIQSNFPSFGYYKVILDIDDLDNLEHCGIGDAIDDLTDIILDLLEVKWRIENNSLVNGIWFFKHLFSTHTEEHILELLNYMQKKFR